MAILLPLRQSYFFFEYYALLCGHKNPEGLKKVVFPEPWGPEFALCTISTEQKKKLLLKVPCRKNLDTWTILRQPLYSDLRRLQSTRSHL